MGSRSMKNRHSAKKKHPKIAWLFVIAILVAIFAAGGVGLYTVGNTWLQDLPDYEDASAFNTSSPTEVYASDGTTLLAKFQLENRDPVEINQISEYVLKGTVATEDVRFYEHNGVDIAGIARALVNNVVGGELEGASTITQQFVRNTILSEEMSDISIKRKVREAYLSLKLEQAYSKDEILLMYLNTINYGSGAYGIQAASQRYFSKDATDLTLVEAATLIGIPQSPTYNNPIDNPDNCLTRRNVVLDRMLTAGVITQAQCDAAKAEPIALNPTEPSNDGIVAYPYFTSYVRDYLTQEYSYTTAEIFKGGLKVITTLDVTAQAQAEAAAAEKEAEAGDPFEVALSAVDPQNGHIVALVGGNNYYQNQVNLATGTGGSGRMPGSSFKTFTLVTAIEKGISPQTYIDCSATATFPGWTVENINKTNYGTRTIARAFAVSSNTGFARLILSMGPSSVVETAQKMGITSDLPATGSLTLGSASVTPLEMSEAYATLANGGIHYDATPILTVTDSRGVVLVDNENPQGVRVLSEEVAHAAVEVMKTVVNSYEGTGSAAALSNGQVVAGKTGTSEEYKDSWFCGITPQLSVSIWLGDRNDYNVAESLPTYVTAASAFKTFVEAYLGDSPTEDFPTAADPTYTTYTDAEYNIGGYGYSYSSNSSGSSSYSNSSSSSGSSSASTGTSSSSTGGTTSNGTSGTGSGADSGSTSTEGTGGGGTSSGGGTGESGGASGGGSTETPSTGTTTP